MRPKQSLGFSEKWAEYVHNKSAMPHFISFFVFIPKQKYVQYSFFENKKKHYEYSKKQERLEYETQTKIMCNIHYQTIIHDK